MINIVNVSNKTCQHRVNNGGGYHYEDVIKIVIMLTFGL